MRIMEDWTEKYRPKVLSDIIGQRKAIDDLFAWAQSWSNNIPKQKGFQLDIIGVKYF